MNKELSVIIDLDDIVQKLLYNSEGHDDLFDLIVEIDNQVGEWDFSLRLADHFDRLRKKHLSEEREDRETRLKKPVLRDIDPGVCKLVELLRTHGFETTDSGDGKAKLAEGAPLEDALDYPHVFIKTSRDELVDTANKVMMLLEENGVQLSVDNDTGEPFVTASYDPADESAVVGVIGVQDTMLNPAS
jgi:hypothetical protein